MIEDERVDWGDDGELGSLLDAYAAERLRSDPEAAGRARALVVAEARRRATARSPRHRTPWLRRPLRGALVLAASLVLVAVVGGVVTAGSGPGGPFYGARLWAEELTLPSDPAARAEAELTRLEARLSEARDAAAAGNGDAVTAALDAYRRAADAALAAAGTDPTRQEHLALQLGRHVAVLAALVGEVPGRASEAIRDAVERSERKIEEILSAPPKTPGAPGTPAKPEATPKPTPKGKPEATPGKPTQPEATPKPTPAGPSKTPPGKPEATPVKPAEPEATPKPTKSPPPNRPTPAP